MIFNVVGMPTSEETKTSSTLSNTSSSTVDFPTIAFPNFVKILSLVLERPLLRDSFLSFENKLSMGTGLTSPPAPLLKERGGGSDQDSARFPTSEGQSVILTPPSPSGEGRGEVNKKSPARDFAILSDTKKLFLCQLFFNQLGRNNFFPEAVGTCFFRFYRTDHFREVLAVDLFHPSNYFLSHGYLISLCKVYFFRIGLYFFNSIRSVVFLRFLVVI